LRNAILLIGGDKTGDNRFYEKMIPIADDLYDVHLKELHEEGLLKMSGHKPFSALMAKMPKEAQARARAHANKMRAELPLAELRAAMRMSQTQLASILQVDQPAISRLERKADMMLSTLASYIEAMGGQLQIVATFPDGEVKIKGLAELGDETRKLQDA
jgi:DNA-binding XRE family transcriptional regulator